MGDEFEFCRKYVWDDSRKATANIVELLISLFSHSRTRNGCNQRRNQLLRTKDDEKAIR